MPDDTPTTTDHHDDPEPDPLAHDVAVPEDADYYYCSDCGWTADRATLTVGPGESVLGTTAVACNECGNEDLLVNWSTVDGYIPAPVLPDPADHAQMKQAARVWDRLGLGDGRDGNADD